MTGTGGPLLSRCTRLSIREPRFPFYYYYFSRSERVFAFAARSAPRREEALAGVLFAASPAHIYGDTFGIQAALVRKRDSKIQYHRNDSGCSERRDVAKRSVRNHFRFSFILLTRCVKL